MHPLIRRLNDEWAILDPHPVPPAWRGSESLSGTTLIGDLPATIRHSPDPVLGALLAVSEQRALAHRVVMQAMLGRVILDAGRDRCHGVEDYLGELWLVIASYPLERRPRSIAANIALDTRKRVVGRRVPEVSVERDHLSATQEPPVEHEVEDLLRYARRAAILDPTSERTLRLVYQAGLASDQAATVLGITPSAVRQRCRRAIRRLAAHADQLV